MTPQPNRPQPPGATRAISPSDVALYAVMVGLWGASFIGIEFQLGVVPPEVSIFWRYLIASVTMVAICVLRGRSLLGFSRGDHAYFVALGLFFFSLNYVLIYHGQVHLTSGLAAIIFTMALFFTALNARLFLGSPLSRQIILSGLFGIGGLIILFGDSLFESGLDASSLVGVGFMLAAAYVVSMATIITAKLNIRRVPVLQANGWGMIYGALFNLLFVLALGHEFVFEWRLGYVLSLLYLSLPAGVLAFLMYFEIVRRIGPARASYFTLMSPMVAVVISVFVEGLPVSWSLGAGVLAVLIGNYVAMRARVAPGA
jgi:drug/metabolite transporter (DMT)-like permease